MPSFLALAVPTSLIVHSATPEPQPEVPLDRDTNTAPTNFLLDFLGYVRYFVEQGEALVPSFFNHMEMGHHLEVQYGGEALLPTEPGPEETCRHTLPQRSAEKAYSLQSPAKQLARGNASTPPLFADHCSTTVLPFSVGPTF